MSEMDAVSAISPKLDIAFYKTLLESTNAIPWQIEWSTLQFSYIGPQIEALLGWSQDSWKSVEDWAERMHPEDRDWAVDYCVSQSKAGADHEADYRALTKDGEYIWIRDVVHVVRDNEGAVKSLIGFMFDISERKKIEDKLFDLQKELEDLSFKDGLTNVANRRMFDSVIEVEWTNARRNNQPLSLILFDIDFFKQFNDIYGHIQGDDCLKKVAKVLSQGATRSRDFFARYGGEEFVLVLPETDNEAARKVADRCRSLVFREQIPHQGSSASQVITVSMGLGSTVPQHTDNLKDFLHLVDQRLYLAKQQGRNRMVDAG
ncbi:sensor domain-containing diguanylate cyclase [Gilvimarinus sp. SDUM040013]|uniref:diguanylate cyclase n=1 Tax=Gilvimarinus gilvus TaxID=3058038 RepID=A0ABU4S1T0_9GAMM|nr:sensor domain-containing diguanylate cyclase [Gilvimarinus sp. SDUM040013]MDO3384431.1 sensor domain-containing diguanylate cyclase [Gilvimarinus sp. SDUM040013]MDX6851100.1 sensor domain-containing diguanylate cyclase [Gilvimarinus sp. SDUM040013]